MTKNQNAINKYEVGKRIKGLRTSKGINLEQFGELFDPPASKSIVSRWEAGKSIPSNERLKVISDNFNVSTVYLLYGRRTLDDWNYQEKRQLNEAFENYDREGLRKFDKAVENQIIDEILEQINSIDILYLSRAEVRLLHIILMYIETSKSVKNDMKKEAEEISREIYRIVSSASSYIDDYLTGGTEEEIKQHHEELRELSLDTPAPDLPQRLHEFAKTINQKSDI